MITAVTKLTLNKFLLRKAIGTTLHATSLSFMLRGSGSWSTASVDPVELPRGATYKGQTALGITSDQKLESNLLYANLEWAHFNKTEEEYNEIKKKEKEEEEANKPNPPTPTDPSQPEEEEPEEDIFIIIDDLITFDPEFIKLPSYEIEAPDFDDPLSGK